MRRLFMGLAGVTGLVATDAHAQQLQATHGAWRVFSMDKTCYIASVPTQKSGNYKKRAEPFVLVTHRGAGKPEMSISSGYPYKQGSTVDAMVDKTKYTLFTQGDRAWAYDTAQDAKMASALQRGSKLVIRGTSAAGTFSQDTYSLNGFTAAIRAMQGLCR